MIENRHCHRTICSISARTAARRGALRAFPKFEVARVRCRIAARCPVFIADIAFYWPIRDRVERLFESFADRGSSTIDDAVVYGYAKRKGCTISSEKSQPLEGMASGADRCVESL